LFDHTNLCFSYKCWKTTQSFQNLKKKILKKSFFLPENSARSWAATKKWLLERLGVNHVTQFFWKNCENYIQKWILQVIIQRSCLDCSKNKIDNNFFITSPNRMNQSFTSTQNVLFKIKKFKKNYFDFLWFFLGYLPTSIFGLLSHNFWS